MNASSQCAAILDALSHGKTFTSLDAVHLFGSTRLGGRIYDLRQQGYDIESVWETDGKKRWVRYRLKGQLRLRA